MFSMMRSKIGGPTPFNKNLVLIFIVPWPPAKNRVLTVQLTSEPVLSAKKKAHVHRCSLPTQENND